MAEKSERQKVVIKPEHKAVLDKIRAVYTKNGADLFHQPEDYGDANPYHGKTDGPLQISFDYGSAQRLETPDGGYVILGSHGSNYNGEKTMRELKQELGKEFDVEEVKPQRNDEELRRTPEGEMKFQTQYSGPLWRLTPKKKKVFD